MGMKAKTKTRTRTDDGDGFERDEDEDDVEVGLIATGVYKDEDIHMLVTSIKGFGKTRD